MCQLLKVSRSSVYSYREPTQHSDVYEKDICDIFYRSHSIYGSRKIQAELRKLGHYLSRRRISRIMHNNGLVSVYTKAKYRNYSSNINEEPIANKIERRFDDREKLQVVVSDLTYVRVGGTWNYICILLDLHAREIIGTSCGKRKNSELVYQAFASVDQSLSKIQYFHTDRGSEFKNYQIEELLEAFGIERSLSAKGTPYDNAVAEATFKIIKTEFVRKQTFENLTELKQELSTYVYWFNHKRIHSTLGYMSPVEYQEKLTNKFV